MTQLLAIWAVVADATEIVAVTMAGIVVVRVRAAETVVTDTAAAARAHPAVIAVTDTVVDPAPAALVVVMIAETVAEVADAVVPLAALPVAP